VLDAGPVWRARDGGETDRNAGGPAVAGCHGWTSVAVSTGCISFAHHGRSDRWVTLVDLRRRASWATPAQVSGGLCRATLNCLTRSGPATCQQRAAGPAPPPGMALAPDPVGRPVRTESRLQHEREAAAPSIEGAGERVHRVDLSCAATIGPRPDTDVGCVAPARADASARVGPPGAGHATRLSAQRR